ncbi:hypothetical protein MPLB_1200103 [Mesorhizobium sp. ORS 3324]|nr:hypothetical protein MPLB_1200103 [Mesorhizobium sp. ORS 3324]
MARCLLEACRSYCLNRRLRLGDEEDLPDLPSFVIHGRSGSEADTETRGSIPFHQPKDAAIENERWR